MPRFKYNPGDISENNCQLISRDYKDNNNSWVGTFKCLDCGTIFQNRLKRVFNENTKNCSCHSNQDNLLGQEKGIYKILSKAPRKPGDRSVYWNCLCKKCGLIFEITSGDFNRRTRTACPHTVDQSYSFKNGRPIKEDLTGNTYGKLKVLGYLGNQYWACQCSCGNQTKKHRDQLIERRGLACSTCLHSISSGEILITSILEELNINFIPQKSFDTCRFPNTNALARFDFYLPDLNIAIEFNGEQHYQSDGWFSGGLEKIQYRDNYKIQWCKENNIKLIIIPYTEQKKLNKEYLEKLIENYL